MNSDLNLPIPFRAGDIVTVDCRPFAPVSHAVILEVGDNFDCCCVQALYRRRNGTWDTGAVKHGYILPGRELPQLSPLYRLATFHGQLPKEERLMEQVSRYVNGEEARGSALWNAIVQLTTERRKRTVTEGQLRSLLGAEIDRT